ncbi:FadR/GntR family transcriptional regulator [Nocardia alni]|uniref:FadR/GntR family transcriptional regulator n=1 Tax=Nocardia alni TaxID=2815723 RepID=UPI001C22DB64|nr:FCD domain-containing protein [Nocardia alni]
METAVETEPADESDAPPVGKLATRVAQRIEESVIRSGWPVGDSLGSETELREQFGVSRSVLREAIRLIEHHQVGRMRRGPGGGLFVCAPDAQPATRAMVIYLEYVGTTAADLLEARLLLEPIAAGLAADLISEEGIATLRTALDQERAHLREPVNRMRDPVHTLLGQLSGNPLLHLFIDVLARLTARYAYVSPSISAVDVDVATNVSHDAHRDITQAVIDGDGARAQVALAAHLESVAAWITQQRPEIRATADDTTDDEPKIKLAEVLAGRIHDDIAADGWRVGTVLGSENELVSRYGISRAVLREAVRLLEYHSVARMRRGPGGGLVVAEPEPQASIDAMALLLEYQGVTADDFQIVRGAIELGIVTRVAARSAGDEAERLAAAVRWPTEGPPDEPRKADLFHTELAAVAGNPVLSLFLSIVIELFRRHAAGHDRPLPGDRAADEVEQAHGRILEAIRRGDVGVARHRMRHHLDALLPWWH